MQVNYSLQYLIDELIAGMKYRLSAERKGDGWRGRKTVPPENELQGAGCKLHVVLTCNMEPATCKIILLLLSSWQSIYQSSD